MSDNKFQKPVGCVSPNTARLAQSIRDLPITPPGYAAEIQELLGAFNRREEATKNFKHVLFKKDRASNTTITDLFSNPEKLDSFKTAMSDAIERWVVNNIE